MMARIVLAIAIMLAVAAGCEALSPERARAEFERFELRFGRAYATSQERAFRFGVFRKRLERIEQVNAERRPYQLGVNKFTDQTTEELHRRLMAPQDCSATNANDEAIEARAHRTQNASVDWRDQGVVTAVKDQGNCGSCYAFSTTGAVESAYAIKYGKENIRTLSEQQIIDCAGDFGDMGCNGGLPSQSFQYIMSNKGIDTEDSYPYEGVDGNPCRYEVANIGANVVNEMNITEGDESGITDAVANVGPVSIAFDVEDDFFSYSSGIYSSTQCGNKPTDVNHAVLVVGYGTDSGNPYWIIKNSWGTDFGMDGYFWMAKDVNMCGIADCAAYPVIG